LLLSAIVAATVNFVQMQTKAANDCQETTELLSLVVIVACVADVNL